MDVSDVESEKEEKKRANWIERLVEIEAGGFRNRRVMKSMVIMMKKSVMMEMSVKLITAMMKVAKALIRKHSYE